MDTPSDDDRRARLRPFVIIGLPLAIVALVFVILVVVFLWPSPGVRYPKSFRKVHFAACSRLL